ncbi:hypothetical protein SFR_3635 [Streptomyces sp. FR-008]|nr:hypothetical protein SFR_3635 [Streptomyces sp. FR-008]
MAARSALGALLRRRGLLALLLRTRFGGPPCSALGDACAEQVAPDDLDGHDHEQPQNGQETQPHDRQGQL